jgi:hypothetical protein
MKFLVVLFAVILTATPALAQGGGSDAASGLAGLIGMFGFFGFLVALIYSIVLFCLPFIVWGCLRRLTSIRDDIRGLRKELAAGKAPEIGNERLRNLAALVEKNEKDTAQEWQRAREDFTLPST